jgi:delta 1-pyrroline-5-carboxylate dehydrogenase
VADAVKKGARVLTGGQRARRARGHWFEPTVLVNVDHTMAVMREESFGPIIGIQAVSDDAEAVRLMNDTDYGLTAGVYTRDEARARQVLAGARRLGLLELLRPREPAPAVVRRGRFGRRPHAVDLRHPDVHAPEGLAPA